MIQGTEPPEPAHRKPSDDPNVISKTDLDPNDPDREPDTLFLKHDSSIFRQSSNHGRAKQVLRGPNSTEPDLFHHGETTHSVG